MSRYTSAHASTSSYISPRYEPNHQISTSLLPFASIDTHHMRHLPSSMWPPRQNPPTLALIHDSIHPHSFTMRSTLLFFPALFAAFTAAQNNLPSNLPACAQQCNVLVNAQQSCASNQAAYQSCFCQSALLSTLYTSQPVPLCAQCSTTDMAAIQSWYKGTCQQGGPPAANNQATNAPTTTTTPPATNPTTTSPPTTGVSIINQQDSNGDKDAPSGPW